MDGGADNGVAAALADKNAVIVLTNNEQGYELFLKNDLARVKRAGRI